MVHQSKLSLHSGDLVDATKRAAYDRLMRDVLGDAHAIDEGAAGPWRAFSFFEPQGRCVANVDAAILPLILDGERHEAAALRSVAVDPAWRGRGLFRRLMEEALAWCEAQSNGRILLYTEDPELYRRFGFAPVLQHAFVGKAPEPRRAVLARKIDCDLEADVAILREAIARRAPVSRQCTLLVDAPLFLANISRDRDLAIAYDASHDAIVVYEIDDEILTLVDIVAPEIADLATVIGVLRLSPRRVRTLFPPDRLGWQGEPIAEDTGLMLRGAVPPAMLRPFMFPPTAEF